MSWKPAFTFKGQEKPSTNGETYATEEEALASAAQRFMVWTMPESYLAIESDEVPNSVWIKGEGRVLIDHPLDKPATAPAQVQL